MKLTLKFLAFGVGGLLLATGILLTTLTGLPLMTVLGSPFLRSFVTMRLVPFTGMFRGQTPLDAASLDRLWTQVDTFADQHGFSYSNWWLTDNPEHIPRVHTIYRRQDKAMFTLSIEEAIPIASFSSSGNTKKDTDLVDSFRERVIGFGMIDVPITNNRLIQD